MAEETKIEKIRRSCKELTDKMQAWSRLLDSVSDNDFTEEENDEIETLTIKILLKLKKLFERGGI